MDKKADINGYKIGYDRMLMDKKGYNKINLNKGGYKWIKMYTWIQNRI
jgi:hypothetical protein